MAAPANDAPTFLLFFSSVTFLSFLMTQERVLVRAILEVMSSVTSFLTFYILISFVTIQELVSVHGKELIVVEVRSNVGLVDWT